MEILPIKSIREEDGPVVGTNILNLAKLYQSDLGLTDGIVVLPPDIKLKTVLRHYLTRQKEVFEQSLEVIRKQVQTIEPPEELVVILNRKKIDPTKSWLNLLNSWLEEIRSKVFREGLSTDITSSLTAQTIFFTKKILLSGDAYFDFNLDMAKINPTHGQLDSEQSLELEDLVKKANKKIIIPQIYHWVFDGKLHIVKLTPFTQYPKTHDNIQDRIQVLKNKPEVIKHFKAKTAVKVYLDLSNDFRVVNNIDGVIIHAEKVETDEFKIAKLAETAANFPNLPVIFKLTDKPKKPQTIRGALGLIYQEDILKKEIEAFLFARNKKNLLNTQIAIPFVRSVNEFLQLKRNLASLGVSRKGTLKIWLELSVPENIVNLEDYLSGGFDGAIFNLDELASWLGGFDPNLEDAIHYKKQVKALVNFIGDSLKILHKAHIPVLFSGEIALHDELVELLFDKGIWGLVVDVPHAFHIKEQLQFFENHHLKHKGIN